MRKSLIVGLFAMLAAGVGTLALALENPAEAPNPNDPTVREVYAAASAGHLDEAHQMVQKVLANHPRSARAHYVAAEIDAAMKNFGEAREELKLAEQIDPGLPSAPPEALARLRQQIGAPAVGQGEVRRQIVPAPVAAKPFPWGTVLAVAAGVFILWLLIRRRSPGAMPSPMSAAGPGPMAPPPGGFPNVVGGVGSGIVGGLASGLAVGAGVAAGEELVRHAFEHGSAPVSEHGEAAGAAPPVDPNADMGGPDFGLSDNSGWDDGGSSGGDDGGWT